VTAVQESSGGQGGGGSAEQEEDVSLADEDPAPGSISSVSVPPPPPPYAEALLSESLPGSARTGPPLDAMSSSSHATSTVSPGPASGPQTTNGPQGGAPTGAYSIRVEVKEPEKVDSVSSLGLKTSFVSYLVVTYSNIPGFVSVTCVTVLGVTLRVRAHTL
jgi:hypothetical protein